MKIKKGFVMEKVGGSYLAVATGAMANEFKALVRLNGTGAFLWQQLSEGDKCEEDLLRAILEEYEVEEDRARADIEAFKKTLLGAGILDA